MFRLRARSKAHPCQPALYKGTRQKGELFSGAQVVFPQPYLRSPNFISTSTNMKVLALLLAVVPALNALCLINVSAPLHTCIGFNISKAMKILKFEIAGRRAATATGRELRQS